LHPAQSLYVPGGGGRGGIGGSGGIGGLTTSESSSPVFASTASIRAASVLKPACSALNPPSTAANVSVTLLIAAACAAACSACADCAASAAAACAASVSVRLTFTNDCEVNWVVIWADRRASVLDTLDRLRASDGLGGEEGGSVATLPNTLRMQKLKYDLGSHQS
jgi:hypothetical protein